MSQDNSTAALPIVVLVHGAFADASSWTGVIQRLQARGVQVTAPANPLRGISHDSAYLASVLDQIPGPVLVVGHSYGGAVISNAASMAKNAVGLVFVAAFAPEEGERLGVVSASSRDSILNAALVPRQYPTGTGAETAVEFVADPTKIHATFGADLPEEVAAIVAPRSGPSPSSDSQNRTGVPPGRPSRPGQWSRPRTRPPARTWFARWLSGLGQRSRKWMAPT